MNYVLLALLAGFLTFIFSILGSATVFLFKNVSQNKLDIMMSISAGIMLSAAFFSLINPAIELSKTMSSASWLLVSFGLFLGALLLCFFNDNDKSKMILLSITLHNIPEGLALGVAFGSIKYGLKGASLVSALLLTLSIAIQNFPEGLAISLPLKNEGFSAKKAFLYGFLSSLVEPISSVLGAILVMKIKILLPIFLSFAGGAMLFVVVKELIPDSQKNPSNKMALTFFLGFIIMMILEIILT